MRVRRGLIHAGEKSRAAWRTGRIRRKDPRVAHPISGEFVEVRRVDILCAVAAEVVAEIFADEPENVQRFRVQR